MSKPLLIQSAGGGGVVSAQLDRRSPQAVDRPAAGDDLARRFAGGEDAAFDELVDRYAVRVAGLARKLLDSASLDAATGTDDVVQDVFLAAYARRRRFRAEANLWTYLATITVNRCRTIGRRRRLWNKFRGRFASGAGRAGEALEKTSAPAADAATQQSERAQAVRQAIDRLPPRLKEAITLVYLEQVSIADSAEILGIRRGTLDARLSRARAALKLALADWDEAG